MSDPGLVTVLGAALVSAFMFYLAFKIDESHWPFRLMCVGFAIINILTIPFAMQENSASSSNVLLNKTIIKTNDCEYLLTNYTTIAGSTANTYEYRCTLGSGNDTTTEYNNYAESSPPNTRQAHLSVLYVTLAFISLGMTYWFLILLKWLFFVKLKGAWHK